MPKFRKKPIEVEAWQWNGETKAKWPQFLIDSDPMQIKDGRKVCALVIETLEGKIWARRGDWIIHGIADEVYSCKPEIFSDTYEPL